MRLLADTIRLFAGAVSVFGGDPENYSVQSQSQYQTAQRPIYTDSIICGNVPQSCEDNEYRTYDGTCNNLQHSSWGASNQPYSRLLTATYSDGIHAMPVSEVCNNSLPNPRECSLSVFVDLDVPDKLWTLLFMQFGQILAHEISLTAGVSQTKKDAIVCCDNGKITLEGRTNPRCAPITIPENDPYNAPEGIKCKDFFRTLTTRSLNCTGTTKVEEPINSVTAFIDASFMYSNDNKTAAEVREFKEGLLKFVVRKGIVLLPQDPEPFLTCNVVVETEPCYFSGDVRVNQNPQLTILHQIYLVLHNSIAKALAKVNPQWNDEKLFQETRKIVIAKHQHVIYNEFLPPLIGFQNMVDNKLLYPNASGYVRDYDPTVNVAASNEYATAAFRFFHTEIQGDLRSYKRNRKESDSNIIQLSKWFDRPSICEHGNNFIGLTIGLATQEQSAEDRFITNDVLNVLFPGNKTLGSDLKMIDIQRARDHGTGNYVQAHKYFGFPDVKSFNDLEKYMPKDYVKILERLYASVNDMDLIVALSLENLTPDSLSGPTTKAILTEQFKRSRVGDRCFYENGYGKHAFSLEQLNEIRKSTIREFMCYNPDLKQLQREPFKLISAKNPLMPCSSKFNALPWKENL